MPSESPKAPRERLLNAANKLFYEEGIHTVGIDRVIESAGVAKASLYSTFGSKDELVRAYLTERLRQRQTRIERSVASQTEPRAQLLAIFEGLREVIAKPTFRGCAFQRASAEEPLGSAAREVCDTSRRWVRSLLLDLATAAGARDPARLALQLVVLYDGLVAAAQMDRDPSVAAAARDMAATLIDAACGPAQRLRKRSSKASSAGNPAAKRRPSA
ncbi:MAG TPA: TetR/AcrR family transcriptional regulator [Polyangiaceae bacterium]|nr:TetR/AcrR family transcriptional regulator [Polyangiaceae bacterium]